MISALVLAGAFLAAGLQAEVEPAGSISGRVVDASGAPLSGAAVELTGANLPVSQSSRSAPDGGFRFVAIPPGAYRIRATLPGYRAAEASATVTLDANGSGSVVLSLQLGAEERVTVSGRSISIDTASTTTGTRYTADVMEHLPVARNFADIVSSNPGVSPDRGDTQGGRYLALAIYGATSAENQWSIDGIDTTNVFRGTQGKALSVEFVEEVQVVTGGYPAEYGRALGGVVNVVTKSGGNAFHGAAFGYFDSTGTAAAREPRLEDSITQMRVADSQRVDYGADLGGFLVKDRLWFFGAYDRVGLRADLSRVAASKNVSTQDRFPVDDSDNPFSAKLTWNATPATTAVATIFSDSSSSDGAAGVDPRQPVDAIGLEPIFSVDPSTWRSSRAQGGTDYGVRLTQLLGQRATATLQGSFHRDRNNLTAANEVNFRDQLCSGGTPEAPCAVPRTDPNSVSGGYGLIEPDDHSASSRRQLAGSVTFTEGSHTLKFGGDDLDGRTSAASFWTGGQSVRYQNEFGVPYYMHRFYWTSAVDPTPVETVSFRAQVLDSSAYLQDSWKVSSNLTIDAGLRWDGETTKNYLGETVLRFNNEWQPRLGVVWDPWSDGATRIYAFAGRFSYALPTAAAATIFGDYTVGVVFNFDPESRVGGAGVPFKRDGPQAGGGPFGPLVDSGIRAPHEDELTVGVERLVGRALTVGLKGTYRRLGDALETRCDLDPDSPETAGRLCALINPGSDERFARGDVPTCSGLDDGPPCALQEAATPPAKRIYRGLELLARESLGDRLWLQASYVHSSLRGNYDGGVNQTVDAQNSPGSNSDFDFAALWHNAYGILSLDRPNAFRLDGFWATPWRLSVGLRMFAMSGAPLNKLGFFNDTYGAAVFLVPRGSAGRLPALWGTDLTLEYPIAIGPATVTLVAYVFNVFNRQTATSVDEAWSNSAPAGFPSNLYDQPQVNADYGKVTARQDPRLFRAALRVSF